MVSDLLAYAGDTLASCISEALAQQGLDDAPELEEWADRAVKFERRARKNLSPPLEKGLDCWQTLNIQKPKFRKLANV